MSNFSVKIQPIFIEPHPNADRLEIGHIGSPEGWQVVVASGRFKSGDLCAYIGENSVVPEWILKQYGYWNEEKNVGMLAGSKGDRVKAIKLRDAFSLGIVLPVVENGMGDFVWLDTSTSPEDTKGFYVVEGEDVAEKLGIVKYEPPIPTNMGGEVFNAGTSIGVNYDIEDIKNYPNVLIEGEDVVITDKLHGTNLQAVWLNPDIASKYKEELNLDEWFKVGELGYVTIASKGLGAKGLFFKNNEANENNLYIRAFRPYMEAFAKSCIGTQVETMTIVGEVFGRGVQDFDYGLSDITFRFFDVYIGFRGRGYWLNDGQLELCQSSTSISRVPVLYRGPYSFTKLNQLVNAPETEFNCKHVREGGVVKTCVERTDPILGRVNLKHRSEAYMARKGGTEFN